MLPFHILNLLIFFLLWKYIISFKNRSCFKDLTKGGVRGRLRREVICVYIQLIHSVVQQNVTQYCKAIILQFKKKDLIKAEKRIWFCFWSAWASGFTSFHSYFFI